DAIGKFKIEAEPGSSLVVEASGFESMTVSIEEAKSSTNLRLVTNPHLKGSNDPVQVAFRQKEKFEVIGFVSEIKTEKIDRYDNIIWANDILAGRTLGLL